MLTSKVTAYFGHLLLLRMVGVELTSMKG